MPGMRRKSTSGMPVKFRLPDHFRGGAEDHDMQDMVLGATTKVVWKTSSDEVSAYEVVRHDAAVEIDQSKAQHQSFFIGARCERGRSRRWPSGANCGGLP